VLQGGLQQLQETVGLSVAAKEDRGVVSREWFEARIRRAGKIPCEGVRWIYASSPQTRQEAGEGGLAFSQIHPLHVVEQAQPPATLQAQREDRLAQRAGQADLSKAPRRVDRGRARQEDDSVGLA
jgi:hypothetical protein